MQANKRQLDANDYNNCIETQRQIAEAERRVKDSEGERQKFEFRALLNLMEALASLINANKMPPTTLRSVEPYLVQAWAYLLGDHEMNALRLEAITGEDTFGELMKFADARKDKIEWAMRRYHGPHKSRKLSDNHTG
jgi:hypothetical protein